MILIIIEKNNNSNNRSRSRHHQTSGDERNILNEYLRRTRKLLETKQLSINLMKVINIWAVLIVRYLVPFFKWTKEEI